MLRTISKIVGLTALMVVMVTPVARVQNATTDEGADYYDRVRIDRYLDAEVWTNHTDGEYYEGDNIVISFRTSRDAFVAIYSIDSRGRVNLLFPTNPGDDNFVQGGVTYRLPDGNDDFDLVVNGPAGAENIQIIASRERFPIPDWYPNSGLICDAEDRMDYMDYLNGRYFVRSDGQRFAFDRTAIYIEEWEQYYYRPVYYPDYPSWTLAGNIYIDYPYGGSVYVNGIYWGVAPLYIPRIYVGWHTITVYDYYGYCWESDVHITRYNTVVLDQHVVVTSPSVVSKYKEVRVVGYRDPVTAGYPNFKTKAVLSTSKTKVSTSTTVTSTADAPTTLTKKFVRGSTEVVKTDRGYESTGSSSSKSKTGTATRATEEYRTTTRTRTKTTAEYETQSSGSSGSDRKAGSSESSGYYRKKSGSSVSSKAAEATQKATSSQKSEIGQEKKSSPVESRQKAIKAQPQQSTPSQKSAPATKSEPKKSEPEKKSKTSDSDKSKGKGR